MKPHHETRRLSLGENYDPQQSYSPSRAYEGSRLQARAILGTRYPISCDIADTLKRQCRSLRGDKAEAEAIGFGEAAASLIEGWE